MLRKLILKCIVLLSVIPGFTQAPTEYGMGYTEGAPFYMRFYVTEQFFHSVKFTWAQQTTGNKDWHKRFNFPKLGIGLEYIQLGNRKTLGDALGAYYFFEYTVSRGNLVEIPIRFGGGVGYLTKTYNRQENYKNHAIGSHINAMYTNYLGVRFNFSKRLAITPHAGFTHFSNAGLKLPNRGINFLNAGVDITVKLHTDSSRNLTSKPFTWDPLKMRYELYVIGGLRSVSKEYNKRFPAFVMTTRAFKPLNKVIAPGAGLDFGWDFSHPFRAKYATGERGKSLNGIKIGAHGSLGLNFDKVQFTVYAGHYFYQRDMYSMPVYMRLTMQYTIRKNWLAMFSFQAQQHKADHLSVGAGYRF